jgi:hypothetical protein
MFNAELVSLSRGQSYRHVDVLEPKDFDSYGVPAPFGDRTIAFFAADQLIMVHPWGVRIIWYDRTPRTGNNGITIDRILIDGDVSYENCVLLSREDWLSLGLPNVFHGPNMGPSDDLDQIVFSCRDGTIITHDANIVSLIRHTHRANRGVTRATRMANGVEAVHAQGLTAASPTAGVGKINRRQR